MARTKPPETILPETADGATLARLSGLTERRIQQLATEGVLSTAGKDLYRFEQCVGALIEYYREQAKGMTAEKARDQARQAKADADRAEMAAAREKGLVMLSADAKRMWTDGFVKIRDVVQRSTLTAAQKKDLTEKMQKIQLTEI